MIFLQTFDLVAGFAKGGDGQGGGFGATNGSHDGRSGIDSGGADFDFVGTRGLAGGGVYDELKFSVLQEVHRVGPAFGELEDASDGEAGFLEHGSGAAGGDQFETKVREQLSDLGDLAFVSIADADEDAAIERQRSACRHL